MKIFFYEVKDYELKYAEKFAEEHGFTLVGYTGERLSLENVGLSKGCDAVSILGFSRADEEIAKALGRNGIKYLCTRTVGFEHIDVAAANKAGITVTRASYVSSNVADYTVMLALMLLRRAKVTVIRGLVNNFSLDETEGRDLASVTFGVIGTGRIGLGVMQNLSGFGCKILCYDLKENEKAKKYGEYVTLNELYKRADIISLHMPLTDKNYHMIDENAISKMKDGVILINTARGKLIDTDALVRAIESGKVGGAGLDSVEGEEGVCHVDMKTRIVEKKNLFYLKQFPNVIYTPHIAFFTEQAVSQMVESVFLGIESKEKGVDSPFEIKAD
ncbi:MAG: NAD(P)-binding domain-containing protein [Christensenellaceae bacterium]|nr:NAD(P)-binding domain-containing protein [Christensenellaceae bacterium]MDY2851311.1 NAD(P)-dependent oxidoreductase [Christensenellaceae bacterium]